MTYSIALGTTAVVLCDAMLCDYMKVALLS